MPCTYSVRQQYTRMTVTSSPTPLSNAAWLALRPSDLTARPAPFPRDRPRPCLPTRSTFRQHPADRSPMYTSAVLHRCKNELRRPHPRVYDKTHRPFSFSSQPLSNPRLMLCSPTGHSMRRPPVRAQISRATWPACLYPCPYNSPAPRSQDLNAISARSASQHRTTLRISRAHLPPLRWPRLYRESIASSCRYITPRLSPMMAQG
ncbi:unnamed protein product [Chondrus crispus]|uniref:Uncharacterized protein n=1 Tax=Chondrus crispus TaxID=2769 RepID=R7Q2F2_CHOCR|nr:unnamed protein product [Chondrus crispus]CDF32229.1 unnamed protein product [Chondrus crispus]|eukprot:XP_005711894.1 unnamed protein product [Chondrus crispus]